MEQLIPDQEMNPERYILLAEQDTPRVHVFKHETDGLWTNGISEGLDATVAMPELALSLALATLYERIRFPFRPSLPEPS